VGLFAQTYLFFPLELGNVLPLFKGVTMVPVGVYNVVIWIWRRLIQQGLLPALWDTFPVLMFRGCSGWGSSAQRRDWCWLAGGLPSLQPQQ
jgi:hypothetical protein